MADLAPASRRGFAFGVFTAVQGLGVARRERPLRRRSGPRPVPASAFGVGAGARAAGDGRCCLRGADTQKTATTTRRHAA